LFGGLRVLGGGASSSFKDGRVSGCWERGWVALVVMVVIVSRDFVDLECNIKN